MEQSKDRLRLAAALSLFIATRIFATELTVQAASSLTDAAKEIAPAYEKATGDKINFNFGASSLLARQIQEGAPADVFLSADEPKMDALEKAGLLAPKTRRALLSNTLVIVVPSDSALRIRSTDDLANDQIKKIAVSQPESVPVGIYTKEYLTRLRLWNKIFAKVIPTENVRASLAAVESGNVDAGFVYKTDMLLSKKVKVALEISADEGPKISYPIAVLSASKNPEAASKFLTYLASEEALGVFRKYGFGIAQ